jgi:isorenieratene synthase
MEPSNVTASPHAIVIGGGLAGLAAATVLAERGVRVTVVEKERFLGGRAGSWDDHLADGTPFQMERGFHAFFRQYYSLRALMKRVDPELGMLRPLDDYPLLGPAGWTESFAGLPRRTPLNLMALVWRTPSMRWLDLRRVHVRRALEMIAFDPVATYARWDGVTAREYLDSLVFPHRARHMLFDVFAHSFFNPEDDYSAAELLAMFHFYFLGNREGLVFDVMREPFGTALFAPLGRYLEQRGVEIRLGASVRSIRHETGRGFTVELERGRLEARACVLAVDVPALRSIARASTGLGDEAWRSRIEGLDVTLPFAVWRLWLDRKLDADRPPFAGTTGLGILDNVSLYEKLEGESAAWSARTGGSVVELHAYAVDAALDEAAIKASLRSGFEAVYPEARGARVLEERFLLRRDCPSFAPGSHATRPGVATPVRGLALAGDFVALPSPSALMERAVASGFRAASSIVAALGGQGERDDRAPPRGTAPADEVIRTVPRRGVLAPLVHRGGAGDAAWTPST